MIKRNIEKELRILRNEYPVLAITGPRQSGKTTLAKMVFKSKPYLSFEDPLVRNQFNADPHGFIRSFPKGAVFDEVQHVPNLFSYLQGEVDANAKPGRFVLTGSQQFGMVEKLTQSLAGRIGLLTLLPFDSTEINRIKPDSVSLDTQLMYGNYPAIYDRRIRPSRWYANYITTYIQRDVRQISQIHNLEMFTLFLKLCAGNIGQLVNTNKWGAACGVDHKTIKHWLSILQASYIIRLLHPYHTNFKKRLIKTPKLFFYDTGLVCRLLGIENRTILDTHPLRGSLVENWVFTELIKAFFNNGKEPSIYFWRTQDGEEIDFIIDGSIETMLIEVKSGMSLHSDWIKPMKRWLERADIKKAIPYIIYGGTDRYTLQKCTCLGWASLPSLTKKIS